MDDIDDSIDNDERYSRYWNWDTAGQIEKFEYVNKFWKKSNLEQIKCYLYHALSKINQPITNYEEDVRENLYSMKKALKEPRNKMKVINFEKYIENTVKALEAYYNKNNKNPVYLKPRLTALTIIYICAAFSLLGFTTADVVWIVRTDKKTKHDGGSELAAVTQTLVDIGIMEWFKSTLEYQEFKKKQEWKEQHPNHTHPAFMDRADFSNEQFKRMCAFWSKSPARKYKLMVNKLQGGGNKK